MSHRKALGWLASLFGFTTAKVTTDVEYNTDELPRGRRESRTMSWTGKLTAFLSDNPVNAFLSILRPRPSDQIRTRSAN